MNLSNFDAFIFDVDGTLIDSEKYHLRALRRAMREIADYELTPRDAREFSGNTSLWLARRIAEREGFTYDPEQVKQRKFELLAEDYRTELFPGAADFVRRWAGRKPLALASNSPLDFVRAALEEVELFHCFDVVVTIDDVRRKKPDPEMIFVALERLNAAPRDCLVFEDTALGLEAARAAGCPAVILRHPGRPAPESIPPEVPVRSWAELVRLSSPREPEATPVP